MARKKIGRNEPCWCGSGRKFKHCHLNKENQAPPKLWEVSQLIRQELNTKKCLAPSAWLGECQGKIVRAHTVPKSGSLQRIAREGHVYSINLSLESLQKNQGSYVPKLLGINKASTFWGFCSKHDDTIFAPLEKRDFNGTPEQCFLIGYRALTLELYKKHAAVNLFSTLQNEVDKGNSFETQVEIQNLHQTAKMGFEAGLQDLNHYKSISDKILETHDFDTARAYIIELEEPPPVMGSGGFDPNQDFDGHILQDIADPSKIPDTLYFTSFYGGKCGVVAFTWLPESDPSCCAFIKSLDAMPDELITTALLRCFFEHCENLHMKPDWWDGLPDATTQTIMKHMKPSLIEKHRKLVLGNDGITYDPWPIKRRYKIPSNLEL